MIINAQGLGNIVLEGIVFSVQLMDIAQVVKNALVINVQNV